MPPFRMARASNTSAKRAGSTRTARRPPPGVGEGPSCEAQHTFGEGDELRVAITPEVAAQPSLVEPCQVEIRVNVEREPATTQMEVQHVEHRLLGVGKLHTVAQRVAEVEVLGDVQMRDLVVETAVGLRLARGAGDQLPRGGGADDQVLREHRVETDVGPGAKPLTQRRKVERRSD